MRKPNFLVLRVLLGGAARKQQERERDNISNRLQIGNKCTRSVWIFSLPKLPMIGMQESYYYIYIVCTKTKTHNSTFSSLKNQLHEREREIEISQVLCNVGIDGSAICFISPPLMR